jgi:hypothetical protein
MSTLNLNILSVPTYDVTSMIIVDASTYIQDPPIVISPTLEVDVPNFGKVFLPFNVNSYLVLTTSVLGITDVGVKDPLPDGIYTLKYTIEPAYENFVEKTIMRVERLQEKFDSAFMKLDMMVCDEAIKTQAKVDLQSIGFFIQGSIVAGNKCAIAEAIKLYTTADKMLKRFMSSGCGCTGNNFVTQIH